MMLSPQRETSGHKADLSALVGGAQGLQALAQTVIAGKTVYLQGAKISPAQVDHKWEQLRSGAQLDADIDENAMAIIKLKLEHFMGRGVFPESLGGTDLRGVGSRQGV
jgi:hypothetical protein